jgi:hypothetical protein
MAELYLGVQDQRPEYATGGQRQAPVRLPNPWDAPPWNGSKAAYLRDQVASGANFSSLLSDPEFAAEYERLKAERDARHEQQQNTPEYRAMVEADQRAREQRQHDALRAQQARSGGVWGDAARAFAGTVGAPVALLGAAAGDTGQNLNYRFPDPAPKPGTPGTIDYQGLGEGGAGGAGGGSLQGAQLGVAGAPDPAEVWQRALDGMGGARDAIDDSLNSLNEQFDMRAPDATALAAARRQREQDLLERIDALGVDPAEFADRALAQQLAVASTTAGGGAAQRGAAFQALLQAPERQAAAAEAARAAAADQARLAADVGTTMSAQELAEYQSNLGAATTLFGYSSQLEALAAQLSQSELDLLGAIARDIGNMSVQLATLDQNAKIARIEAELQKYSIDKQLEGILAQLQPGQAGFSGTPLQYLISIGLAAAPLLMKGATGA